MNDSHHNAENWILLLLLTGIWGTSYILIKKGLTVFTPVEVTSIRISISFLCALPFVWKAIKTIPKNKYFTILQIGIFGSGAPAYLFATSMTKSGSAVNGIINSLSPIWTLLIGYYLYKLPIAASKAMGVAIGFLGALVLVTGVGSLPINSNMAYAILPVIATFCYGLSTNITKQKLQDQNALYTTALAMCMIGVPAFIGFLFSGAPAKIASGNAWYALSGIAFLSVFGTLIAWMLFYRLVQRTDALFAASVTYLIPLVAISWGLRDGEKLSVVQFLGMALILVGVYFTNRQQTVLRSSSNN